MTEEPNEEEIEKPNLTIADFYTVYDLILRRKIFALQKGNSLLEAEGAHIDRSSYDIKRVGLWAKATPFHAYYHRKISVVYPFIENSEIDGKYPTVKELEAAQMSDSDIVLCPALSPSDTAKLKKKISLKNRLVIGWGRFIHNDINRTTEYECMDGEPADKSFVERNKLRKTGKTYPIFDQKERKIVQIPEIRASDGQKYAQFNEQYYPIVKAKGYFVINDEGEEIFIFSNVRMVAPIEVDRNKKYTCLKDSYMGKEVFPAIGLSLLPTKDWLREKELENSSRKTPTRHNIGFWVWLGRLASSAKKNIKASWNRLFGLDVLIGLDRER